MNNNILYNAALIGFIQGVRTGRGSVDDTAADYSGIYLAASSYALSLDTLILNDTNISIVTTGLTAAPTTGAIAAQQNAKVALVRDLSAAIFSERFNVTATAGFYAEQAAAVAAQYAEGVATLTTAGTLT